MKPLRVHHLAWLEVHPDRTEQWLRDVLKDGFDVHHIDGDHANNAPSNLVLIEHLDHMGLHGMKHWRGRLNGRGASKGIAKPRRLTQERVDKILASYSKSLALNQALSRS